MTAQQAKARSFRALHASALRSEGVSFEAAALFLLIASFANSDGSNCYPSMTKLAAHSGHDPKWVKRKVAELKRAGWLTWVWKGTANGRVNLYTLHWAQIGPDRVGGIGPNLGPTGQAQNRPKTLLH